MIQVTDTFVKESLPIRDRNGHKGTFGKVHILAGSVGFTGAPAFAANSAVRTGSGLVFLSVPENIWPILAVKCNEAMPSPVPDYKTLLEKMNSADAVLIGPGLINCTWAYLMNLLVMMTCGEKNLTNQSFIYIIYK